MRSDASQWGCGQPERPSRPTSAAYLTPSIACSEPCWSQEPQCRCSCRRRYAPLSGPPLSTAGTRRQPRHRHRHRPAAPLLQPAHRQAPAAPASSTNAVVGSSVWWGCCGGCSGSSTVTPQRPNKPLCSWQVDTLHFRVFTN